jgi:hypothetical protein
MPAVCVIQTRDRGVSILYRLLSSIKTPITNTTKAIPNNAISIKVMTLTVYLPTLGLRVRKAGLTEMVAVGKAGGGDSELLGGVP